jgi:site-specific DNA-methyltransferase (adenine-specific)
MGKSWDSFVPPPAIWDECLRVLKPGGHLLAFAGTRTYDLMGISIRMAGFEIRDSIGWVYGSGFPKSMNVAAGIEAKITTGSANKTMFKTLRGEQLARTDGNSFQKANAEHGNRPKDYSQTASDTRLGRLEPTTPEAKQWQGWGTALKPALEPIVVARKPLIGTVAENVLTHGTGGLNIDASRIGTESVTINTFDNGAKPFGDAVGEPYTSKQSTGRWPANLILDEYTAELLDEQSGDVKGKVGVKHLSSFTFTPGGKSKNNKFASQKGLGDSGGASRFFYVAKASKRDRNEGLEDLEAQRHSDRELGDGAGGDNPRNRTNQAKQNFHPTVKPTELMRYLVKLITPPGGTVLDPFTGSGSTGKAAILEGFDFIGIELTEDYWPIIEGRLKHAEAKVAERIKETSDQEQEKLF